MLNKTKMYECFMRNQKFLPERFVFSQVKDIIKNTGIELE